jgi:hypothetical protein
MAYEAMFATNIQQIKSAYRIRFQGQLKKLSITPIWKARTEPKYRIFAWILLHRRILTADNLEKRGWPNDPLYKLCNLEPETPTHLCKDCTYTKAVWDRLQGWFLSNTYPPTVHRLQSTNGGRSVGS